MGARSKKLINGKIKTNALIHFKFNLSLIILIQNVKSFGEFPQTS